MNTQIPPGVQGLHVVIAAPRDAVFGYLADIENLPRWAGEFCERLELTSRGWLAWTLNGDLFLELESDAHSGVIDVKAGSEHELTTTIPLRVWALPEGGTMVSCWLARSRRQSDEEFERLVIALRAGLQRLREPWRSPARLCA